MAKLINGNGNKAIWAAQDADLIASICGDKTCITKVGSKFAATQEDANTIGLSDGVIITKEGRRIQLDTGAVDLFDIPTGTAGVTSYYIIGYHLITNSDSSQTCETFVQKMDNATDVIAEDTFKGGATDVYVSCYRVTQVGLNINTITRLLPYLSLETDLTRLNKLLGVGYIRNTDLNTIFEPCSAIVMSDCSNLPDQTSWYTMNEYAGGTGSFVQELVKATTNEMFFRHYNGNTWGSWRKVDINDTYVVEKVVVTFSGNGSSAYINGTENVAKTGYTPIACVGYEQHFSNFACLAGFYFSGSTFYYNIGDGRAVIPAQTLTANFWIMYLKN